MRIVCPNCGERGLSEFSYGGDASVPRPSLGDTSENWSKYLYERKNPSGSHAEFWQHALGCRAWLKLERDTKTHVITMVSPVGRWVEDGFS